jgi:hypothetical protein
MGRSCTICHHLKRADIELALLEGELTGVIADRFEVTSSALKRHRSNHMNAEARQHLELLGQGALDLPEVISEEKALRLSQHISAKEVLLDLKDKAQWIFDSADGKDSYRVKLSAITELRNIVETMFKCALIAAEFEENAGQKEQDEGPPWPRVKEALIELCRKCPAAREEIVAAIGRLEDDTRAR